MANYANEQDEGFLRCSSASTHCRIAKIIESVVDVKDFRPTEGEGE